MRLIFKIILKFIHDKKIKKIIKKRKSDPNQTQYCPTPIGQV